MDAGKQNRARHSLRQMRSPMINAANEFPDVANPCRILSLDGGGAKGFYTLGVLKELEAMVGRPLYQCFDLIFGTSTGGIIAALLGAGLPVDTIHALYKEHVPAIMRRRTARGKSEALAHLAKTVFGDRILPTSRPAWGSWRHDGTFEKPMIFKADVAQAHGRQNTFVPGFGCTIADAVQASCSAYPFSRNTSSQQATGNGLS